MTGKRIEFFMGIFVMCMLVLCSFSTVRAAGKQDSNDLSEF